MKGDAEAGAVLCQDVGGQRRQRDWQTRREAGETESEWWARFKGRLKEFQSLGWWGSVTEGFRAGGRRPHGGWAQIGVSGAWRESEGWGRLGSEGRDKSKSMSSGGEGSLIWFGG